MADKKEKEVVVVPGKEVVVIPNTNPPIVVVPARKFYNAGYTHIIPYELL